VVPSGDFKFCVRQRGKDQWLFSKRGDMQMFGDFVLEEEVNDLPLFGRKYTNAF